MKPALVLIDMQRDYLAAAGLEPAAGAIVERVAALSAFCRQRGIPVVHVWTTVHRTPDDRMEHWKRAGRWTCEEGTPGHAVPEEMQAAEGEKVVHKQHFSGFAGAGLAEALRGCDTVILAGVHLHACVRATALDAYARGLAVWIAADAVGSDDPIHAAITRRYLADRCVQFVGVDELVARLEHGAADACADLTAGDGRAWYEHRRPMDGERVAWRVPVMGRKEIAAAGQRVAARLADPKVGGAAIEVLGRLADGLLERQAEFGAAISLDVGKPIRMARAEVRRSVDLLRAVAREAEKSLADESDMSRVRRRPLGVVGLVTPWNNPLAIPVGKLAPAIAYGNGVLWKPAPAGTQVGLRLLELWRACDAAVPIELVIGDREAALAAACDPHVEALTLSGSAAAGDALAEIAIRRHTPWQAELGGNNAAIIAEAGADKAHAAREVAAGAFGFAGQRCTANRRVIVPAEELDAWCEALVKAAAELVWGDPGEEGTVIGPVISVGKRRQLEALLQRAAMNGCRILPTHGDASLTVAGESRGAFARPTIVVCEDARAEIVQEESFGPILVVQPARSFEEALALCNGVRQGLVAALFGGTPAQREAFLARARAGILKLDQSTVDADAESPFGGWKASGVGPAEHGGSDREFYTRVQTIYGI